MKYCTNCGEALMNLSKFCRECGQKIDHDGNLKPKKEDIESPYFIPVEVFDNGSKWGTIDTKGNWVIQPQLDTIYRFDENGMADAEINEKWGVIDTKGNWVIQPQFDNISSFDEGMASAEINEKWGMIDTKGNWVIQPQFDTFFSFDEKGMANAEINEKWGLIDTKGNWVIQPQFDDLIQFDEKGMALVIINQKKGMIDTKGNWVIQPQFDSLGSFNDGLAPASTDLEKIGFIDTKGNWVIQPKFDYFYDFDEYPNGFDENGFSIACINDKYGLINKKGDWVIDSKYDRISLMYENHSSMYENQITYYKVHSDGKVGFIGGSNLNLNIPLIFEDADLLKAKYYEQLDEDEEEIEGDMEIDEASHVDLELYLSTFVDNETTFLGHEDITNALNSKSQKKRDLFNEGLNDWMNDNDIEPSEVKYNFMYNHSTYGDPSILLVFTVRNEIATYILGDQRSLIKDQTWIISPWGDRSVKLQVLKEKKEYAVVTVDEDPVKFRIWKPKNGFFSTPWTKWKYRLTDIVAAINDACEEYNKYTV